MSASSKSLVLLSLPLVSVVCCSQQKVLFGVASARFLFNSVTELGLLERFEWKCYSRQPRKEAFWEWGNTESSTRDPETCWQIGADKGLGDSSKQSDS